MSNTPRERMAICFRVCGACTRGDIGGCRGRTWGYAYVAWGAQTGHAYRRPSRARRSWPRRAPAAAVRWRAAPGPGSCAHADVHFPHGPPHWTYVCPVCARAGSCCCSRSSRARCAIRICVSSMGRPFDIIIQTRMRHVTAGGGAVPVCVPQHARVAAHGMATAPCVICKPACVHVIECIRIWLSRMDPPFDICERACVSRDQATLALGELCVGSCPALVCQRRRRDAPRRPPPPTAAGAGAAAHGDIRSRMRPRCDLCISECGRAHMAIHSPPLRLVHIPYGRAHVAICIPICVPHAASAYHNATAARQQAAWVAWARLKWR